MNKSKSELIQMVDAVMKSSACTMDFEALMRPLEKQLPGVDIGRLIFDPPSGKKMTAAEVVDLALSGGDPVDGGAADE